MLTGLACAAPIEYDAPPNVPKVPAIPRSGAPRSLPGLTPSPWPRSGPLTLDEAVSLAISRNPSIKAQIADVEARVARIYQTASGVQPKVEVRYSATRFEQPLGAPFSTAFFGTSVVIQAAPFFLSQFEDRIFLTQLLSDGGKTRQLIKSDVASARAAMADLIATANQLQYDVRTAFIAVLEAQAEVDVAKQSLATAEEHLHLTKAQFEAGQVARADITFSTTPVTRARIAVQTVSTRVQTARAHLNALVCIDPAVSEELAGASALPETGNDLPTLRRDALASRPDMDARRREVDAQAAALDAAGRSRSVNVQATAGFREIGYQTKEAVPQHPGWSAGLEFSYPLLDGGLISAQMQEARARLRGAQERADSLARQIDEQVVTAWLALEDARERRELAHAEVEQAEEGLAVAQGQYNAGVGTNLQVLDAQTTLTRARTDEVTATFAVQRAVARLLQVTGR